MQGMKVDHITNTIVITKAFNEAARDIDSEEYMLLQKAKTDNPTMRVVLRSIRTTRSKSECKGLTYDYMRKFIRVMDIENIVVFEKVIAHYEAFGYESGKLYQCVKDWFLQTYPNHKEMIIDSTPKTAA